MQSKIKGILNEEMPREKLIKLGPQNLTNVDLLAILLRVGTHNKNVIELSREVLEKFSDKSLTRQTYQNLLSIKGISKAKACQIVSVFELARRLSNKNKEIKQKLNSSKEVFEFCQIDFKNLEKEKVMIILIDSKNQVIRKEFIFEGSIDFSFIDIREIIKKILLYNASGFFLLHNHPSGDLNPSCEDINITKKIKKLSDNLNIRFLDHLIISDEYYSLFDNNLI